ncbi:MAG: transposase [Chryseobacterium sp.]|nr:transposase [Chryseobacterium sp.]OJX29699.1 MAG: transposase [Chryseobacterium sp. 36-9]
MNFKDIHIGQMIKTRVEENNTDIERICNFLSCTEKDAHNMYEQQDLSTDILLKWSKLLEYDFFRLYSQHLILYAPSAADEKIKGQNGRKTILPQFRKNIYTKEIIDFILQRINSKEMTKNEVIERYKIPKTTLYKWIIKHEE